MPFKPKPKYGILGHAENIRKKDHHDYVEDWQYGIDFGVGL